MGPCFPPWCLTCRQSYWLWQQSPRCHAPISIDVVSGHQLRTNLVYDCKALPRIDLLLTLGDYIYTKEGRSTISL